MIVFNLLVCPAFKHEGKYLTIICSVSNHECNASFHRKNIKGKRNQAVGLHAVGFSEFSSPDGHRPSASTADKGREARSVEDRPSARQYWQHRGPDRALSQASSHCSSAAVAAAQWLRTGHTRGPDHHHDQMSSKLQQAVQAQWAPTGVAQPERRSAQAQLPSGQLSEPDLICQ